MMLRRGRGTRIGGSSGLIASQLGLVRILSGEEALISDIWLLQLSSSHDLARVRALADHVAGTIENALSEISSLPLA